MEEEKKPLPSYPEEESDFGYLAKLSEAYKRTRVERRKLEFGDERKTYLAEMQRELAAIGRALLSYYEREEKKELAVFLRKNAESILDAIGEKADDAERESAPTFARAMLLTNRSLDLLRDANGYGDLTHMVLAEISALFSLFAIG